MRKTLVFALAVLTATAGANGEGVWNGVTESTFKSDRWGMDFSHIAPGYCIERMYRSSPTGYIDSDYFHEEIRLLSRHEERERFQVCVTNSRQ